jgi:predicted NBD/HSP70 family sugar kinase
MATVNPVEIPLGGGAPTFARRPLRPRSKLLASHARSHHRSLILQSLFRDGPGSRADLARITGLTKVTVADLVADLAADGLVAELGPRAGTRPGKPATLVGLDPTARCIVAIDLSDVDELRGALVDLRGRIGEQRRVPLGDSRGEAAVRLVLDLARDLVAAAPAPVLALGVGSTGVVDSEGVVRHAPHLGWTGEPLQARLQEALAVPVHVANDANLAALAESTFGGAQDDGLVVVTVAHGVGAGLLIDGALVQGHRFAAGEIGHVVVDPDGAPCVCGRIGCLETVLAAPALHARAAGPDPAAALAAVGRRLGQALAPVVSVLNVREVVLRGPADLLAGPLLESATQVIRARTMPIVGDDLDVRLSALGADGVLLGAAGLVLSARFGIS